MTWSLETTALNVNQQTDRGLMYSWKVRARDNAGDFGGWAIATFGLGIDQVGHGRAEGTQTKSRHRR